MGNPLYTNMDKGSDMLEVKEGLRGSPTVSALGSRRTWKFTVGWALLTVLCLYPVHLLLTCQIPWFSGHSKQPAGPAWSEDERDLRDIPQYVLDYAPLIHLYSGEEFWPCDIAEHLVHTTPHLNYTPLQSFSDHPKLNNLDQLNNWGRWVYLQSDDDVEGRPKWLGGERNIPSGPNKSVGDDKLESDGGNNKEALGEKASVPIGGRLHYKPSAKLHGKRVAESGRSDAPAVLVVVNKDDGIVDAFWFFFYSYNLGNQVLNVRFGNHVGDWEHTLVRFKYGKPIEVFFSEHSFGEAYTYEALEKRGERPIGYSATGTHAMYATPGTHPYVLPWGLLHDVTDRGPLWDPTLNMHAYVYDHRVGTLWNSKLTPESPKEWFYYIGHWGDKVYPLSDPRQYVFAGQYHYVTGPLGPRFKNLDRRDICQGGDECLVKDWLPGDGRLRKWRSRYPADGEELGDGVE